MRSQLSIGLLLLVMTADGTGFAADARFEGKLSDGVRVSAAVVANWGSAKVQPSLAGRAIFDANNPFRWLIDTSQPMPRSPDAYLEFVGGDRLPGEIIGVRSGNESPFDRLPPHLLVAPHTEIGLVAGSRHTYIRVTSQWLRRVVWHRRVNEEYRPGTLFLRDGREFKFRALRWKEKAVTVLRESGIEVFPFQELAEVHLPREDEWDAYFDQLAVLTPDCSARLIQLETTTGLRLTTSTERFQPQSRGDGSKSDNWFPIVQPAWSLDPLAVSFKTTRVCRFFAPQQVPLTLFMPVETLQESAFGSSRRWQIDRNVEHGPLQSAAKIFGWGFGVHATNKLQFKLHPLVRSFRASAGLDQLVGLGGCARAAVYTSTNRTAPLFRSAVIVGSNNVVPTGMLSLNVKPNEKQRLILVADSAHNARPSGADPFDIRDSLDWLEPELLLDLQQLKAEVAKRAVERIPAWQGWRVTGEIAVINHWETTTADDARYIPVVKSTSGFLTLSRSVKIGNEQNWLAVCVNRFGDKTITPTRMQVQIDGRAIGEFMVPVQNSAVTPVPAIFSVKKYRGRTVNVSIVQMSEGEQSLVDWRGIAVVENRPGLLPIFEDDPQFPKELQQGDGKATLTHDGVHAGAAAVEITETGRSNVRLPGLNVPIRVNPQLGEFRYIRFAWFKQGGTQIGLDIGHDGEFGIQLRAARFRRRDEVRENAQAVGRRRPPKFDNRGLKHGYRYYAGSGKPLEQPALGLGRLPVKKRDQWKVETRDLYADFGDFTFTGLGLRCPDGDLAMFDHIYLGRSQKDFVAVQHLLKNVKLVPPANPDPNIVRQIHDLLQAGELLGNVAPAFSIEASGKGVTLLKEHAGQKNIVRTYPVGQGKPCILRAPVNVAQGKRTVLELTVSHQAKGDWQLVVKVAGEKLHDAIVSETTTTDGWANVSVDLSKFAGKRIVVEVHNHPNNWTAEAAYWQRIAIVQK